MSSSSIAILSILFLTSSNVVKTFGEIDARANVECGIRNGNETLNYRIAGGEVAKPNEYPWIVSLQVLVGDQYKHLCGAALIHPEFVVTAAQCTVNNPKEEIKLVAGKFSLNKKEPSQQQRDVKSIKTRSYQKDSYENDIALIQVTKPFDLNQPTVAPICLPEGQNAFYDNAILAGWGKIKERGPSSNELMKVSLPLIDTNECKDIYTKAGLQGVLYNCQICTSDKNGKGGCQKDTGGPLMCIDRINEKSYMCGIFSFGGGCSRTSRPEIYTNVNCFTKWIRDEVKQNAS